MRYFVSQLRQEHEKFIQLLSILTRERRRLERGESPHYALMLDIVRYITRFSALFHQPGEDRLLSRLAHRVASIDELIDQLRQSDEVNREHGEILIDLLHVAVGGSVVSRDELAEICQDFVRGQRLHMAREESDLYRLADANLTEADWEALRNDEVEGRNPFADKLRRRYEDFYLTICGDSEVKPLHYI